MTSLTRLIGGDRGGQPSMPWDEGPSILDFILSHISPDEPGLTAGGYDIPDRNRVDAKLKIPFAPGARDGIVTQHMRPRSDDPAAGKAVELILSYCRDSTPENKAAIYRHLIDQSVVSIIDPVVKALVGEKGIALERLHELAHTFATKAPDREPVKFGIAVLGLFRHHGNMPLFMTLGRHDEFTLFCAVAIGRLPDADEALWTLARYVTGWGRIHLVQRLARTGHRRIQRWLLREGYRNTVGYGYLAVICARAGGLRAELGEEQVDRELLTAAGEIIEALIEAHMTGGPAEGIDHYEGACPMIEAYLRHIASSDATSDDFRHVNAIRQFLDGDDGVWARRYAAGWTAERRNELQLKCSAILRRDG
jgi:hypothetical protein